MSDSSACRKGKGVLSVSTAVFFSLGKAAVRGLCLSGDVALPLPRFFLVDSGTATE